MQEEIKVRRTRRVFCHEGVVMLEVCLGYLEEDSRFQKDISAFHLWQSEILEKAERYLLPKQIEAYTASENPRKKFSFPRLVLTSTPVSPIVLGEVLQFSWIFRLEEKGKTAVKREISLSFTREKEKKDRHKKQA